MLFTLALYFQFTAVNVNPVLGQIYVVFAILAALFIILDISKTIPLKKGSNSTFGSIMYGAGAYIVLVLLGNFIIVPGIQAIRKLLSSTTPVLAQSQFLNGVTFGIAVPIIETTFLFAVSLDFLSNTFNIRVDRKGLINLKTWVLIIILSFIFMLFHLSAKGITNIEVLTIVFFMAIISFILILLREDYEAAIWFHIICNLSALFL